MSKRNTSNILGIAVDNLSRKSALEKFKELMAQKSPSMLATPNTEMIVRAQQDLDFRDILNKKSKLNLADSVGILWAAKFLVLNVPKNRTARFFVILLQWIATTIILPVFPKYFSFPIPEKNSGSDFVWDIARLAAEEKYKIFLLGGGPTVAERAALKLQTDVPNLRIAGVSPDLPRDYDEIAAINKSRADILIVCFGAPKQENWLSENLSKTCAKIGIGLGGTLDFISGERQRAPKWMQRTGLEWLFRLVTEPSRISRQLSIPKFMWLVLLEKLKS